MEQGMAAYLRKKCVIIFTGLLIAGSGSAAYTNQKGCILLGYAVIPDITRTLDVMEKIASDTDPVKYKPGMFKAEAGKMLNDPALANIDRTKPFMVNVYYSTGNGGMYSSGMENISYAFFIPVKNKESCKQIFKGMNMHCTVERNVLVAGNKKISLDSAVGDLDLYKKTAADKVQADLRILIKIDSIMSVVDPGIEMLLSRMKEPDSRTQDKSVQSGQADSILAIGKLFMYGMLDLFRQSKDYQLDISLNEKTLLFSSEHSAKPGSDLCNFFDGIAPEKNRCLTLLPEKGDFTYSGYFDTRRLNNLIGIIVSNSMKRDPSLEGKIDMEILNIYRNIIGYYLGEFAVVYGFDNNSHLKMDLAATTNRSALSHIRMNERFIALYRETLRKMSPATDPFTEYRLHKNVRKSGGFDVHRYVLKMNYSSMTEVEKASMLKMFGSEFATEYSVANGFVLASTSPDTLDKMIENTVTGGGRVKLQSVKIFGPGMDSYYDLDIAGFIKKILMISDPSGETQQDPGVGETLDMLDKIGQEDRILVSSSKYSKGISYNRYRVSVKMIANMVKFFNGQKSASLKGE